MLRYAHLSPDFVAETVLRHFPALLITTPIDLPKPARSALPEPMSARAGATTPRQLDLNLANRA